MENDCVHIDESKSHRVWVTLWMYYPVSKKMIVKVYSNDLEKQRGFKIFFKPLKLQQEKLADLKS